MVKVRSVREHTNAYGEKLTKAKGDEYDLPEKLVKTLADAGLVEEAKAAAKGDGDKAGK